LKHVDEPLRDAEGLDEFSTGLWKYLRAKAANRLWNRVAHVPQAVENDLPARPEARGC
jgi:hypothetical protein